MGGLAAGAAGFVPTRLGPWQPPLRFHDQPSLLVQKPGRGEAKFLALRLSNQFRLASDWEGSGPARAACGLAPFLDVPAAQEGCQPTWALYCFPSGKSPRSTDVC